jgi:hypothetical protein
MAFAIPYSWYASSLYIGNMLDGRNLANLAPKTNYSVANVPLGAVYISASCDSYVYSNFRALYRLSRSHFSRFPVISTK